jgi:hypothetical protein
MDRLNVSAGDKYGRLSILREAEERCQPDGKSVRRFVCLCECGTIKTVDLVHLRSSATTSCGCRRRELAAEKGKLAFTTHGHTGSRTHNCWHAMRQRCNNPKSKSYPDYGGRCITVCQRWQDSFEAFLEDMGECPAGLTIDRIDNDGNYNKPNCRWATRAEQNRNTRHNHNITFDGMTLPLVAWAEKIGITQQTLSARINTRGWSVERALTEPVHSRR